MLWYDFARLRDGVEARGVDDAGGPVDRVLQLDHSDQQRPGHHHAASSPEEVVGERDGSAVERGGKDGE